MRYRIDPRLALIGLASLTLAVLPGLAAPAEWQAITLESPDLLKPPVGVAVAGFTVAKTAPKVDIVVFTGLPEGAKGTLWSSWGDGCIARNGKYYTSIGDHQGKDAHAYVYEYDPATKRLRQVVDVAQATGQRPGQYGHGKIHSGIHQAADGRFYFATYWGKHLEVEAAFGPDYQGSVLLRYDPRSGKTENLGAIAPRQGLPASLFDAQRGLLYFHAVYKGDIVVYDVGRGQVRFRGGGDVTQGDRTFMRDPRGRVYFSAKDGTLGYYDPDTNKLGTTSAKLPSAPGAKKDDSLRAAARPTRAGLLYGMTAAGRLFRFDPLKEKIDDVGPNLAEGDYTAVMALSPDERFLYYAPGAHGSSGRMGTPVVQYELATGRRKVLAFLNEPVRRKLSYNLGGTYNLQIDPSGERLFITFNGAPLAENGRKQEAFGQPSLVVLHIPASER
jgi:sugar lactone lactonase YvrE